VTTTAAAAGSDAAEPLECWCCGSASQEAELVRLGRHPEVGVCLRCAHFLHQQARLVGTTSALAQVAAAPGSSSVRYCRIAMTLPPATVTRVATGNGCGPSKSMGLLEGWSLGW
jgi:hypothetical protein